MSAAAQQSGKPAARQQSRGFSVPVKRVGTVEDVARWRQSELFALTVTFISRLNSAVRGVPGLGATLQGRQGSEAAQAILEFLTQARTWIAEIPAAEQAQRFGNKAFRQWHDRMNSAAGDLHKKLLPANLVEDGAAAELIVYMLHAFGSRQRIDYGTGHELCFVIWMTALHKLQVLPKEDAVYLVMVVFHAYLRLMRELQRVYWLEPAGSKGVWGLDDYQFLPFLWGSSQLCDNQEQLGCAAIADFTQEQADRYMYLDSIRFVTTMKRGGFHEHSPMLYQTSKLASWEKINRGMVKLYDDEVLNKFPVVQHVLFGSILSYAPFKSRQAEIQQPAADAAPPKGEAASAEAAVAPQQEQQQQGRQRQEPPRGYNAHGPGIHVASIHSRVRLNNGGPQSSPSSRRPHNAEDAEAANAANPRPRSASQRRMSFPDTFE